MQNQGNYSIKSKYFTNNFEMMPPALLKQLLKSWNKIHSSFYEKFKCSTVTQALKSVKTRKLWKFWREKSWKYIWVRLTSCTLFIFIIVSKRDTASSWIAWKYIQIWKSLGNSDLNFPTSGPWLLGCKYVSIMVHDDFTLLLIGIWWPL